MIRVCALDFLNRGSFESDVKLANGQVLISTGEKITSELILMLYFKEIYVDEPLPDVYPTPDLYNSSPVNNDVSADTEMNINSSKKDASLDLGSAVAPNEEGASRVEAETDFLAKGETDELDLDTDSTSRMDKVKAPELDLGEDEVSKKQDNELGELSFDVDSVELPKEDRIEEVAKAETVDVPEVKDEEAFMVADPAVSKEIEDNVVKLAKLLSMPADIVKDLGIAASICNLGVVNFKMKEMYNRDFEHKKARASYDLAMKKGQYSESVLNIVRDHARHYKTEVFNLSSKIPACELLHIATVYSKFKYQGFSNEQALMKMLEKGGNEFNIFALHKFLRMMRDND